MDDLIVDLVDLDDNTPECCSKVEVLEDATIGIDVLKKEPLMKAVNDYVAGTSEIDYFPDDKSPDMETLKDAIVMLETLNDMLLANVNEFVMKYQCKYSCKYKSM